MGSSTSPCIATTKAGTGRSRRDCLALVAQAEDPERGHRPAEPLELELVDGLGHRSIVDRGLDALADQDLAGRRAIAETGGEVGHDPDRRVVVPALEPDATERRVPGRDPDAEPELVSALSPLGRELGEPAARL